MKCLVSSYRKEVSLKLWKGDCNSLVIFLKLLLFHLNNGKSQILEILSYKGLATYWIQIPYILQMKKLETQRNYASEQMI